MQHKTSARVIVTKTCNRSCENCCNANLPDHITINYKDKEDLRPLLDYKSIILTGGEPMLVKDELVGFIIALRDLGYTGKFYLQTAFFDTDNKSDLNVLSWFDGITLTIHKDWTVDDFVRMDELARYLASHERYKAFERRGVNFSARLRIDSRADDMTLDLINRSGWKSIEYFEWQEECGLPENEDLFVVELS